MTCEEMRRLVWDRIDGGIEDAGLAALDAHIMDCAQCAAYDSEAKSLHAMMPEAFIADAPDLVPAVLAKLEVARPRRVPREDWLWLAAGPVMSAVLWALQTYGLVTAHDCLALLSSARSLLRSSEWARLCGGWGAELQRAASRAGLIPWWGLAAAALTAVSAAVADRWTQQDARRHGHG